MALIPSDDKLKVEGDDETLIEVSFAFDEKMPESTRRAFVMAFGEIMAEAF
jgi:hypothetical protein